MASPYERSSSITWTDEKTRELIELYKWHPNLWDCNHTDYGKHNTRHNSFSRISERLKVREDDVKARIAKLRTKFESCWFAQIKAPNRTVDWPFFKPMEFLAKYYRNSTPGSGLETNRRAGNENIEVPATNASADISLTAPAPPSINDSVDQVFLIMAGLVKHFPRYMLTEFYAKMMAQISEMDKKLANHIERNSSAIASTSNGGNSSAASSSNGRSSNAASASNGGNSSAAPSTTNR